MISTFMILTALTTAALGKGAAKCTFFEPAGGQQCFGALGQPLLFCLPATADTEIKLTKDNKHLVFKVKKKEIMCEEDYINQSECYTNGTLNLGNAMKKHSGAYTLEEFRLNGSLVKKTNIHLQIQAPLSEPAVSQVCLSPEQMKVTCSSEGDGVQFNLTLDGQPLIQTKDYSLSPSTWTTDPPSLTGGAAQQDKTSISSVTISLHGQLTGDLMCNVQNNVSRGRTVFHLTSCKDLRSSFPFMTVSVTVGIATLLLVAFCLCIKSLHNKLKRPISINAVSDSNSEVIYADVKVKRKVEKPQPTVQNTP